MFLFLISFLLVFVSSYLLVSVIAPKKNILGLIYLFLIAFSQIVLTFEILSLFTAINQFWVLTLNVIFVGINTYVWNKKSRPIWSLSCSDFRNKLNNSLKLDKSLMWLYVGFLTFIIVAIILNAIMPITSADAQGYHCARSLFWVLQGSLNHFVVADIRNLCLPINSEILYAWVILFFRTDALLGFFAFVGYWLAVISIYNILGLMGYCVRKKLWVIFILSSFSSVIVQVSGTETDIIIAGLVTSCIFLFWYALKNNEKTPIFMASLAYALAIGTKTTALMAIPGVWLLLLALCFNFKKYKPTSAVIPEQKVSAEQKMSLFRHLTKVNNYEIPLKDDKSQNTKLLSRDDAKIGDNLDFKKYKPLGLFLGFGVLNFLIFSSYNYILNIIDFHSISGPASFMVVSKNYYGIKGMIANFIKYIFMFIDVTGFRWSEYVGPLVVVVRNNVLHFLHLGYLRDGLYSMPYGVNNKLLEPVMGAGVLGFLVFIPSLLWALIKPIFKRKSKKVLFIWLFALVFIINLLSMSYLLAYMSFSVRFIMSFMVISSPILIYSYLSAKNPFKYIIIMFSLFYLMCVSTHLWPRPFMKIARILVHEHHSLAYTRYVSRCKDFDVQPEYSNGICPLKEKIQEKLSNKKKILAFINTSDCIFILKALEFKGYKIDFGILEDAQNIDFNKYNYVITPNNAQTATYIKYYEKRKNECHIKNHTVTVTDNTLTPCIYQKNITLQNTKNKETLYPFQSYCGMSDKFLTEKHLLPVIAAGLIKPNEKNYTYYIIYQNASPKKK